jgi:hypothetical protein
LLRPGHQAAQGFARNDYAREGGEAETDLKFAILDFQFEISLSKEARR